MLISKLKWPSDRSASVAYKLKMGMGGRKALCVREI